MDFRLDWNWSESVLKMFWGWSSAIRLQSDHRKLMPGVKGAIVTDTFLTLCKIPPNSAKANRVIEKLLNIVIFDDSLLFVVENVRFYSLLEFLEQSCSFCCPANTYPRLSYSKQLYSTPLLQDRHLCNKPRSQKAFLIVARSKWGGEDSWVVKKNRKNSWKWRGLVASVIRGAPWGTLYWSCASVLLDRISQSRERGNGMEGHMYMEI